MRTLVALTHDDNGITSEEARQVPSYEGEHEQDA